MIQKIYLVLISGLLTSTLAWADLTITAGGDVNFNRTQQLPLPHGSMAKSGYRTWSYLTSGIQNLIDGDINFANIETVVTDRTDLRPAGKQFNFQTHPHAIENLIKIGFNLFSLANNHAIDYGSIGTEQTAHHMSNLQRRYGSVYFHGVGVRDEVLTPTVFRIKGYTIAFAAIGILHDFAYVATRDRSGMLKLRDPSEVHQLLRNLRDTPADFRIFSIHTGQENSNEVQSRDKLIFRAAVDVGNADLVLGHHPHVMGPIEYYKNRLIFYSLGNYMMLGATNMGGAGIRKDFGVFAKIKYEKGQDGRLGVRHLRVIPLTEMHERAVPMSETQAAIRLRELENVSRAQFPDTAVTFDRPITAGLR